MLGTHRITRSLETHDPLVGEPPYIENSGGTNLSVKGLLLDLDGVLAVSWEPVAEAIDAVKRLRAGGIPIRIVTNATNRGRTMIAAQLRRIGFDVSDEEVLKAAVAAASYLTANHPGKRVFLLGDAQPEDLVGVQLVGVDDKPEVILISGADPSFAFDNLNRVYRLVLAGVAFVAMHRSLSWMTRDGECLDAGAYLVGLERAAGRVLGSYVRKAAKRFDSMKALKPPPNTPTTPSPIPIAARNESAIAVADSSDASTIRLLMRRMFSGGRVRPVASFHILSK